MRAKCDFCNEIKNDISTTKYGTTNYTRLICQDCIQWVNQHDKSMFGHETLNEDGSFKKDV